MSLCWSPLTIVQLFQLTLQYAWNRWGQYFDISGWCCRGKSKLPARQHLSETRADTDDSEDGIVVFICRWGPALQPQITLVHKIHQVPCSCVGAWSFQSAVEQCSIQSLIWFTDIGHIALVKELLVLFCQTSAWLECFHQYCINLFFLTFGAALYSLVTNVITFAVNVIHLWLGMWKLWGENHSNWSSGARSALLFLMMTDCWSVIWL